jgi:hypothetical protein
MRLTTQLRTPLLSARLSVIEVIKRPGMTRSKYLMLSAVMVGIYAIAQLTDLDLGGFGIGLLIIAAGFGVAGLVSSNRESS